MEEVEEDPEDFYYYVEVEDGCIMEIGPDRVLVSLAASPELAAPASAPPAPPIAPAPDALAPTATGGDRMTPGMAARMRMRMRRRKVMTTTTTMLMGNRVVGLAR
jgi:hypothetical protein